MKEWQQCTIFWISSLHLILTRKQLFNYLIWHSAITFSPSTILLIYKFREWQWAQTFLPFSCVSSKNNLYSYNKRPLIYLRCIDDIAMHGATLRSNLMTSSTSWTHVMTPLSKFTFHYSHESVNLHANVEVKHNKFSTQLYRKPTNKWQLLHYTSHHPNQSNNIRRSQFLCLRIICSDKKSYMHKAFRTYIRNENIQKEPLITDALNGLEQSSGRCQMLR